MSPHNIELLKFNNSKKGILSSHHIWRLQIILFNPSTEVVTSKISAPLNINFPKSLKIGYTVVIACVIGWVNLFHWGK